MPFHSRFVTFLALFLAVALPPHAARAQDSPLDDARRLEVIEKTLEHVLANYVFPDRAAQVEKVLRKNAKSGAYAKDATMDAFLDHLNRDLQAAGNDRHLKVNDNARVVAEQKAAKAGGVAPEYLQLLQENNFRLRRVESLDGNIGYFKFDNFVELEFVKDPFVGAMSFLHHSSALMLDLTENGGGSAETADFLVGYFLPEGTRIGETWKRTTNETAVVTVTRAPEVKPLLDTPLVILVGERTGSAAEAVAYTLQQATRAVVVGSRTRGMANAGLLFPLDDRLYVMVPTNHHKNVVSGTNWEGVGVVPDVAVAPERTFAAGMVAALTAAAERKADAKERFRLRFLAQEYAAVVSPESPPAGFLEACAGDYDEGRKIVLHDGSLRFQAGETDRRLTYMANRAFMVDGRKDYRIRFEMKDGRVAGFRVLWFDDTEDRYARAR